MLAWYVTEPTVDRKVAPIDWAGAGLLTAGLSSLLLARPGRLAARDRDRRRACWLRRSRSWSCS